MAPDLNDCDLLGECESLDAALMEEGRALDGGAVCPRSCPLERGCRNVTLVIAARTEDNVFMLGDKREAVRDGVGTHRDDATKVMRLSGGVLVGFGGPGQWALDFLLHRLGKDAKEKSAIQVASCVRKRLDPSFPSVPWLFASADRGKPEIVCLAKRKHRDEGVALWREPVVEPGRWRATGVGIPLANALMPCLLRLADAHHQNVNAAVRENLRLLHHIASRYSYFIGPTCDLLDGSNEANDQRGVRLIKGTEELPGAEGVLSKLRELMDAGYSFGADD